MSFFFEKHLEYEVFKKKYCEYEVLKEKHLEYEVCKKKYLGIFNGSSTISERGSRDKKFSSEIFLDQ